MNAEEQREILLEKVDLGAPDGATVVTSPPPYSAPGAVGKPVVASRPTDPSLNTVYMAIFAMLFCCWPCGLVGLIYGIQGMQEYYRGQYDSSQRTEKRAKKWVICSIVTGVILVVGTILFVVLSQVIGYALAYSRGAYDGDDDRFHHFDG